MTIRRFFNWVVGLPIAAVAEVYTWPGLLDAIVRAESRGS